MFNLVDSRLLLFFITKMMLILANVVFLFFYGVIWLVHLQLVFVVCCNNVTIRICGVLLHCFCILMLWFIVLVAPNMFGLLLGFVLLGFVTSAELCSVGI